MSSPTEKIKRLLRYFAELRPKILLTLCLFLLYGICSVLRSTKNDQKKSPSKPTRWEQQNKVETHGGAC